MKNFAPILTSNSKVRKPTVSTESSSSGDVRILNGKLLLSSTLNKDDLEFPMLSMMNECIRLNTSAFAQDLVCN